MGQYGFNRKHEAGGTQPEDIQQILGAQWYNADQSPVVGGGFVSGRADLSYRVTAGVGVLATPHGASLRTWQTGNTALVSQPAVDRTDTIYVDGTGQVRVAAGVEPPASVCILDKMRIKAGATSTNGASSIHDRNWALPYGATLGWLYGYGELRGGLAVPASETMVSGRFWVPTDRWVDIHVDHAIFQTEWGSNKTGYVRYELWLDGGLIHTFELPYAAAYCPEYFTMKMAKVSRGGHALVVKRIKVVGPTAHFFGKVGSVDKYAGGFVGVEDKGVAV